MSIRFQQQLKIISKTVVVQGINNWGPQPTDNFSTCLLKVVDVALSVVRAYEGEWLQWTTVSEIKL